MKTPKVDKSPKIVKRPRGRPPLNPKPEHVQHHSTHGNAKKVHGNSKKAIEAASSSKLLTNSK